MQADFLLTASIAYGVVVTAVSACFCLVCPDAPIVEEEASLNRQAGREEEIVVFSSGNWRD